MKWYSHAVYVFGAVFVVIGAALLVVTAVNGGGVIGFLLGGLFLALVSGDVVSKEVEDGTMRMMLCLPASRWRIGPTSRRRLPCARHL